MKKELPPRPPWVPPDNDLSLFFGRSALYPFYRLRLFEYIARLLPAEGPCSVLDVGAGDGSLGAALEKFRPQTVVLGLEVEVRGATRPGFQMVRFDGRAIPLAGDSVDVALISNVLHHADDPLALILEARRVARQRVLVKDHLARGAIDRLKLVALDVLGNLRLGAQVSATYLSREGWDALFRAVPRAEVTAYCDLEFRRGALQRIFGNELEVVFAVEARA